MKLKASIRTADSNLSKIKVENTKKVIALINKGKTVADLCCYPYNYPNKFVNEVMRSYLFDLFSKNSRYQRGEYLIKCNGKVLIDETPNGLRQKFETELFKI
jgi:hypothetical protein